VPFLVSLFHCSGYSLANRLNPSDPITFDFWNAKLVRGESEGIQGIQMDT
jgi:hypothetical protein